MATPRIYYAAVSDYTGIPTATLSFPSTPEYPTVGISPKFETSSSRSLDGSVRAVQVHDGRRRLLLSFRLFTDTFRAQFLAFVNTIRGTRFPFIYADTDELTYFLRFVADPMTSAVRYDLNEVLSLELEGAVNFGAVEPRPGRWVYERDPLGRIITDPLGRPQRVWVTI